MAQTQTYPIRAVSIDDKIYMTYAKLTKPQYAPYLASIQAVMNQYIVPYAYFAMAKARNALNLETLNTYTSKAQAKINEVLSPLGVAFTLNAQDIPEGVKVLFQASKGQNVVGGDHEIKGRGTDFGPAYEQSKDIAKLRWASYADMLTEVNVESILGLANLGYTRFVTGTNPTPEQELAAIKHMIKLSAVDPARYINRLRESVEKYATSYQYGVHKYSYISRWLSEGFVAAFKAARAVFEVL